jgi:hypothetical protein
MRWSLGKTYSVFEISARVGRHGMGKVKKNPDKPV